MTSGRSKEKTRNSHIVASIVAITCEASVAAITREAAWRVDARADLCACTVTSGTWLVATAADAAVGCRGPIWIGVHGFSERAHYCTLLLFILV